MILVIGATGKVGREATAQLADAGAPVRALARDPGSARLPGGVDVVQGDLAVPETLDAAMDGVEAVFLIWPFMTSEPAPLVIDTISRHARHVVYLSASTVADGVDPAADSIIAFHTDIERLIQRSSLGWTFLRSGGFASNTLEWAGQIRTDGVVRRPYGTAGRSLIHERDIASVAVRALTEDGHIGAKYVLTGPQSLTQMEQLRTIGEAIGRPLRWEETSRDLAQQAMLGFGWPRPAVEQALDYWAGLVTEPETVTPTVEQLTGAPGHTFQEWAADHAADFR